MTQNRTPPRLERASRMILETLSPFPGSPPLDRDEILRELERPCCFVFLLELELRFGVCLQEARLLVIDELTAWRPSTAGSPSLEVVP